MSDYDLVIVGMGSGGMPAAEFAVTLGLHVAVVERGRVGGDCLWTGCVPSKALLASAKVAQHLRTADRWGLPAVDGLTIDTALVWRRIHEVRQRIASSDDDPARFEGLGIEVVHGDARLADPNTVEVDGRRLTARFILVCTGSRPTEIPVPGLAEAGYVTSETIFDRDSAPSSLVMIGGGPICIELSQGLHRLGVPVTVLQKRPGILPRDEPELAARLAGILTGEGLDLQLNVDTQRVLVADGGTKVVEATQNGRPRRWEASELFVAAGRSPNVEGLGLEALGIEVKRSGIVTDDRMRTSQKTVYAAGDVAGRALFTHAAAYEAVRAVRDMFFPGRGTAGNTIPWCTFTDPELAHVGMTQAEARAEFGDEEVHVWKLDLAHSDRARADGTDDGAVWVVTGPRGKVVGGHILAAGAGEMIHELALAEKEGLRVSDLAGVVHVYPTLSTSIGQLAAESAFEGAVRIRRLTRFLAP